MISEVPMFLLLEKAHAGAVLNFEDIPHQYGILMD